MKTVLAALVRSCLSARAAERPLDAGAVADVVAAHLAGVQERLRRVELERVAAVVSDREERKRRRLAVALGSPFIGVGLLLLFACLVGAWQINHLQTKRNHLLTHNVASLDAAQELEIQLRRLRFYSFVYLVDPVPERLPPIEDSERSFEGALARARAVAGDEDRELLDQIEAGYRGYRDEMGRLRTEADKGPRRDVHQLIDLHPLRAALDPCQQLVGAKREAMARSVSESNSVSETLHLILLLLGLGGPAGGALSAYGIARGMGRFARRSQPLAPEG